MFQLRISGLPFFAEWLLYIAPLLKTGRYVTPFDPDSRFAPIAAVDIARIIVAILENPGPHIDQAYQTARPGRVQPRRIGDDCGTSSREIYRFRTSGAYGVPQTAGFSRMTA